MNCAGIHRELSSRVKSIGHASFTPEEVEMMKTTDNDKVNSIYLARYDPQRERMKMPQDNNDRQHLKAWIHRKYHDKAWYGNGGGGSTTIMPSSQQHSSDQPTGYGQPTLVQMPPRQNLPQRHANQKNPPQQQYIDPFSQGSSASVQQPLPTQQTWDAFSALPSGQHIASPRPQQQNGFGNFSSEAFPADFGSSQTQQELRRPQAAVFEADFSSAQQSNQAQPQQSVNTAANQGWPQGGHQQHSSPPFQADFSSAQPPNQAQPQPPVNTAANQGWPQGHQQMHNQRQPPLVSNYNDATNTPPSQMNIPDSSFKVQFTSTGLPSNIQMNQARNDFHTQDLPEGRNETNLPLHISSNVPENKKPLHDSKQNVFEVNQLHDGPQTQAAQAMSKIPAVHSSTKDLPSPTSTIKSASKYRAGQKVYYRSASQIGPATIVKVHLDDELEPFYTIAIDGKEKQTDDAHLSKENPAIAEISEILLALDPALTEKVKSFALSLTADSTQKPNTGNGSAMTTSASDLKQGLQSVATVSSETSASQFSLEQKALPSISSPTIQDTQEKDRAAAPMVPSLVQEVSQVTGNGTFQGIPSPYASGQNPIPPRVHDSLPGPPLVSGQQSSFPQEHPRMNQPSAAYDSMHDSNKSKESQHSQFLQSHPGMYNTHGSSQMPMQPPNSSQHFSHHTVSGQQLQSPMTMSPQFQQPFSQVHQSPGGMGNQNVQQSPKGNPFDHY